MNYYSGYGVGPGGVQLGMQPPGTQLTPEQVKELQRIRGLGGQQSFTGDVSIGGRPSTTAPGGVGPQAFLDAAMTRLQSGKAAVGQTIQRGQQMLQSNPQIGRYARLGVAGLAAMPALGEAQSELQAGRPTGAAAALLPAGLSTAGAFMLGKGPVGTAVGLGLMGLGAVLPGAAAQGAESIRQKVTGEPTKGKEGDFSTQMAMAEKMGELGLSQYRTSLGVETSNIKDLSKFYSDQAFYDLQRNIPLINQIKNADLVRQQALLNTQGQINARLGVLATAGSMAQNAQNITGQTVMTAMQTNPYAGATLQAPQIRFG